MGMTHVPATVRFTCDVCGKEDVGNSRPKYWTELNIIADAYDFHGCAVASANHDRLLCSHCTGIIHAAINKAAAGVDRKANDC